MSKITTNQSGWKDKLVRTCGLLGQPLIALIFLALLGWFGFREIKQIEVNDKTSEWTLMLDINVKTTQQWIESKKAHVRGWANYKDSHQELLDLIAVADRDKSELLHSKELAKLRERLIPVCKAHGHIGFVVFDKSGAQIGAWYDEVIGQGDLTSKSDFVQRSLQGETVFSKPFRANAPLPDRQTSLTPDQPTQFVSTPIRENGEIVGVLAFRLDPNEFTRTLEGARFGETGETYAFDSMGMMLSDSRFNDQLKSLKIIPDHPNSRAMLTVKLNVPGEKQLNRMASSATKGKSGIDVNGYPDYRGIAVVGAWTWLPEFGFGIATEIDTSEAFEALFTLRILFAFCYGLIVTFSIISLVLRQRERQAEESRKLILDSAGEGIFGLDIKGNFTFINPSAEKMLSFTATALVGKPAHATIHHSNPDGTPHPENKCPIYATFRNSLTQQVANDMFWRKDGTCFPVEYISTPIFKNGELMGAVVTFNDITQRVQAEAEREHSKQIMRIFIEHSPAPVAMFDRDMRYLAYSRRWLTDYSLGSKNITGLSHYEVFPEIQENWKEIHRRCLAGAVEKCDEDKFVRQDGTIEWLSWKITPWRDNQGQIGGIIMFTEVITERKHMEMALKENEQRLNMAIHTFAGGDWEWNLLTGDVVFTPRWLKSIGYSPGELVPNIDTWKQLVHPDDMPRIGEFLRAYFAGEIPNYEFEYRLRSKSGAWQWRISRGVPIAWDDNGKATYLIGTELDITDRRKSEEIQSRLIKIMESSSDFVGYVDARDTKILYINKAGRIMTGLGADEDVTKLKIADVHPESTNHLFRDEILDSATRDGVWHGECEFLHRDGHTIPVSMILIAHKSPSGEVEIFSTISRDITERKKAQEILLNANEYLDFRVQERTAELNAANELLRKLSRAAEQSPSSIIITDTAGRIDYVNPKFTQQSGYAPEEVIGKNPRFLKSGKTSASEYRNLWETITSGGDWHGEFQNRKKNGDCYWGLASISPIKDAQGKTTHYISSMEDITERKLAEDKIKSALLEKEVLMREINHRAKNNLQVVSSLIKMQSRNAGEPRFTQLAQDLGNRIAAMTFVHDQILQSKDLNQIDTGQYIHSLTRNILSTYGENSGRIKLNVDTKDIVLDVETSVHCGLIVNELLSNSLKYAFAPSQNGTIDIMLRHGDENGDLELIIHDNGAGISEDIDIRNCKSLGMRLVTTLAENQLQGRIELNRNSGTEFKIIFPAVK